MTYYAASALVNIICMSFASLLVFFSKTKPPAARTFVYLSLSSLGWSIGYFFWQFSKNTEDVVFWVMIFMIPMAFNAQAFYHFVVTIAGKAHERKKLLAFFYSLSVLMVIAFIARPDLIESYIPLQKMGVKWFPSSGILFDIFIIQFTPILGLGFFELITALRRATGERQKFFHVVLITSAITYIGGVPNGLLWYDVPIPPILTPLTGVFFITIAFLLLKGSFYRLQLVYFQITASLLILIGGLQFLLSQRIIETKLLNIIMLLAIAGISYFLIKSGKREQEQTERITVLNKKLNSSIDRVINGIDASVIIIGNQGKIINVNSRALWLFDHTKKDMPNSLSDFIHADVNAQLLSGYARYKRAGESDVTTILRHKDIARVDVQFSIFPLESGEDATMIMILEKNAPWGTVFNSKTLEPIPLTIIRVFTMTNKLVATQVTDQFGRFGVMVAPGQYTLMAENSNFQAGFTTQKIGYQGSVITVSKEKMMDVNVNILLDPK